MTNDFGLFEPCIYHRLCRGVVVGHDTICDTCRAAWGPLLRQQPEPAPCARRDDGADALEDAEPAAQDSKHGQLCWLCEQRRRCSLIAGRWECTTCRAVT